MEGINPLLETLMVQGTMPILDNTTPPITNHLVLLLGTIYVGWFLNPPSSSQTDVTIASDFNTTETFNYTVEFSRPLNTGFADDIVLDFSNLEDLSFFVGAVNSDDAEDIIIGVEEFSLASGNDPMEFSWNSFTNPVTSAIVVTGTCYDDYVNFDFRIRLSGWENSYDLDYGYEFWDNPDVNQFTGD